MHIETKFSFGDLVRIAKKPAGPEGYMPFSIRQRVGWGFYVNAIRVLDFGDRGRHVYYEHEGASYREEYLERASEETPMTDSITVACPYCQKINTYRGNSLTVYCAACGGAFPWKSVPRLYPVPQPDPAPLLGDNRVTFDDGKGKTLDVEGIEAITAIFGASLDRAVDRTEDPIARESLYVMAQIVAEAIAFTRDITGRERIYRGMIDRIAAIQARLRGEDTPTAQNTGPERGATPVEDL